MEFFKENTTGVFALAAVIAVLGTMTFLSGCNPSDVIKVKVPTPVQEVTRSKANISLSESAYVRQRYINEVQTSLAQFDAGIEQASIFRDFVASMLNTGLGVGETALAGVPGGGALIGLLAGLGGLYIKKPGTDAVINQQKQDAFNKGQKEALALMTARPTATLPSETVVG